ncbi:MAG: hypothetical protein EHM41_18845 [Chloroflexi bacterium]|nr:MAG: hypothetical protein EHM41_18845 [Chloroflexota bacterium]
MQNHLLTGLRTVFWIHIIVGFIFGLAFLLIPAQALGLYGWPEMDPYFPRLVGAAILSFAASSWFALQANTWNRVKLIVQTEIVWTTLATITMIWGMLSEDLPAITWLNVIIMAAFAVAFTYYYMQEGRVVSEQAGPVTR